MPLARPPRKRKILFAPVDIGLRIELYSAFIRRRFPDALQAESLVVVPGPKEYYTAKYTKTYRFLERSAFYRWWRSVLNFLQCLPRYDVFHFLSGETLLTRKLRSFELAVYKALGKRVIMHFVGADIRSPAYVEWKARHLGEFLAGKAQSKLTESWQDALIADAERYADRILVSTPDLLALAPKAVYFPVVLETDRFLTDLKANFPAPKVRGEIVILHAPSNKLLKGSDLIHATLRKIAASSRYNLKLHLPAESSGKQFYSLSRTELLSIYQTADIVVDQLVIGWYGLQAVEALAAGAQVVCHIDRDLQGFRFPACPIDDADAGTFEQVIRRCIEKAAGQELPRDRHLAWIRRHHDLEGNHAALLEAWDLVK